MIVPFIPPKHTILNTAVLFSRQLHIPIPHQVLFPTLLSQTLSTTSRGMVGSATGRALVGGLCGFRLGGSGPAALARVAALLGLSKRVCQQSEMKLLRVWLEL